jgi:hypothetical protein
VEIRVVLPIDQTADDRDVTPIPNSRERRGKPQTLPFAVLVVVAVCVNVKAKVNYYLLQIMCIQAN